MEKVSESYDVVVVGGGVSGLCAALASARHGAKTALLQARPVLGGNASSEVKMHICGADVHASRPGARETGIIEELQLKNKSVNLHESFSLLDTVFWEKATFEKNLDLYLNTYINKVQTKDNKIVSVSGIQTSTEKELNIKGNIFIDSTGDGTIGYLAGADYMYGRESRYVYNEKLAPQESDDCTMGSSIMFKSRDVGHKVEYHKPEWAYTFTEEDLKCREHNYVDAGYWWVEIGGKDLNTISDNEKIRDELLKCVFGVWDHIKNGGDHGADNLVLDWIGMVPGKRESRRIYGKYVLTENDVENSVRFKDAVAYGGWPMDMHHIGGIEAKFDEPNVFTFLKDVYTIPYRSLVAKDISNLLLGGRNISVSDMAFGSTRLQATTSLVGQAIGTAAAMSVSKKLMPYDLLNNIEELQQTLLKDDCYIPGVKNTDCSDLALNHTKSVECSSQLNYAKCNNVINGVARDIYKWADGGRFKPIDWNEANKHVKYNGWVSQDMSKAGEWIKLNFDDAYEISCVHIKFDSNLSMELTPSIEKRVQCHHYMGMPKELVCDYSIEMFYKNKVVCKWEVSDNIYRFNKIEFDKPVKSDSVKITVLSTYGDTKARVFEIRAYQ